MVDIIIYNTYLVSSNITEYAEQKTQQFDKKFFFHVIVGKYYMVWTASVGLFFKFF